MPNYGPLKVFGGNAGKQLAIEISKQLSTPLGNALVGRFKDGEIQIEIHDNVRDCDVFIVNPTNPPADNFFELILLASAARDASAGRVTIVIPYLGYNRQERKDQSRVPFSAQDVIRMLKTTEADRALLIDLHASATASEFRPTIPDHLYAAPVLIPVLQQAFNGSDFVVAAPDAGGVPRARKYGKMLGINELVIFDKRRSQPGKVDEEEIIIIGDVKGKDLLLIDDMLDSGGTLVADAIAAKEAGAKRIIGGIAHGLFSGDALKRLKDSPIEKVFVTDTVPPTSDIMKAKHVEVVPIAPLLAQAIRCLHDGESLSELFVG